MRCFFLFIILTFVFNILPKKNRNPFAFQESSFKDRVSCKAIGKLHKNSKYFTALVVQGKQSIATVGQVVDGLKVVSIYDDSVLLEDKMSNQKRIFLKNYKKSPST